MGLVEFFIVWFISSWMVFLPIASIGVRTQSEAGDVAEGTEPSAPVNPMILKKFLWAVCGGLIISAIVWLGLVTGILEAVGNWAAAEVY